MKYPYNTLNSLNYVHINYMSVYMLVVSHLQSFPIYGSLYWGVKVSTSKFNKGKKDSWLKR